MRLGRGALVKAILAAAFLMAGAAAAQAQTPTPVPVPTAPRPAGAATWSPTAQTNSQVLPTFSLATIEPILAEVGIRHERRGTPQAPSLLLIYPSGRRAAVMLSACNGDGSMCRALSLQAGWSVPPGAAVQRAQGLVVEFNQRYAFARSFVLANGNLALQRYLTADYGFIRGNLAVNLLAFGAQLDLFVTEVLTPLGVR